MCQMTDSAIAELATMREALGRMADPMAYFQAEARRLNHDLVPHMAIAVEADAGWYRSEARAALATPSPAADALLELAVAAEAFHAADMSLAKADSLDAARRAEWSARFDLTQAVNRYQRAKKEMGG